MPFRQEVCSICLENHENLKHTDENAEDNIKYITKLSSCVPELDWSEDYLLCDDCAGKLNIVYDFRRLCLRSFQLINEKGERSIKYESDTALNNHLDLSDEDNRYNTDGNEENRNKLKKNENFETRTSLRNLRSFELINEKDKQAIKYETDTALNNHLHLSDNYSTVENEENINGIKKNENFNIQTSLCNSLLNKKFKTNRLRNVNRKFSSRHVKNAQISDIQKDIKNDVCKSEEVICFHCNKSFYDKDTLIIHLSTKHSFSGSNSNENENNLNGALEEEQIENSKTNWRSKHFKCSKCLRVFATEKILETHLINCNGLLKSKTNSEEIVEDEVDIVKRKVRRGRKLLDKQIYQCSICNVAFSTKYLLSRHVKNVHATEKLHNCDICGQKFASPVYLSAHKRYHSGERPHICSSCGKRFITASDLYHHEKIHANKRSYKCDKCPKAFNTSSDLHKHNICVHVDRSEWKYVCSFCNKRFPLKTNMDTHVKIHTGEKNFACHLCERRCINKSVLLRHIETHSNVRSFRCNLCNQEYKYRKSLDIHMTKAHGIGDAKIPERSKKYICHICPKSYYANNKLQIHIRTHTGERPFVCSVCEKRFIDKSSLNQHLKSAHIPHVPQSIRQ